MSDLVRVRNHRATTSQREWEKSNLAFLYVEPVRREFCRRCNNSDPLDSVEDLIIRWGVMRRRYPHLSPDQIKCIVRAGLEAERLALKELGGRQGG